MKVKPKSASFENRKARYDYQVLDTFEAGVVLNGLEIKAIRSSKLNFEHSYAKIIGSEIFWLGGVIDISEGDKQRTRKLLLNRSEIDKIFGQITKERFSLIPLKIYFKRGRVKILLGLARGKKHSDKRELIKQREQQIDQANQLKRNYQS